MSADLEPSGGSKPESDGRAARARRFFFGDDVFVSYSRHDAADYALALANELTRRGLSCFLDQWGTPPGSRLPDSLISALRQSTMLVLVGTVRAAASENVREEVKEFLKTGRTIIPITFSCRGTGAAEDAKEALAGTLERATWYDLIRGTSVTVESLDALEAVAPSPTVVDRITNARGFTRRNQRLRQAFWTTLSAIGVLLIAGAAGAAFLMQQAAEAKKSADDADGKRKAAVVEQGKAETATKAAKADQRTAERLKRRATSERIAAASRNNAEARASLALTLGVEAVNVYRDEGDPHVADADEALRHALAGIGGDPLLQDGWPVVDFASSKDGRLFTVGHDMTVRAWDLTRDRPTLLAPPMKGPAEFFNGLALSPDDRWLLVRSTNFTVAFWDLARPDPTSPPIIRRSPTQVGWAEFTPDGRRLLSIDAGDKTAWLWDLRGKEPSPVPSLLCGLSDEMINDLMKKPEARANPGATLLARMFRVASSDDARWVVASRDGSDPTLFDTTKDDPASAPMVLPGLLRQVSRVVGTPDGRRIAVVGDKVATAEPGPAVGVWTRDADGALVGPTRVLDHPARIEAMALSPDGRWLVTGNFDQLARLWDLWEPDSKPKLLKGHAGEIRAVAFSPDSRWLATGSDDATLLGHDALGRFLIQLWDLKPPKRHALDGPTPGPADMPLTLSLSHGRVLGHVRQLTFSPDGHWLAARTIGPAGVSDREQIPAYLWHASAQTTDSEIGSRSWGLSDGRSLRGHQTGLKAIRFIGDGRRLATAGFDGTARVWGLEAESLAAAPIGLSTDGYAPTVLATGRWLVSAGATVRLWDLASPPSKASGDVVTTYQGPPPVYQGPPPVAAVDARGRWLAASSANKEGTRWELRLFDLSEPKPADRPIPLEGHARPVDRIVIDPDGRRMATAGRDGTVLVWDLTAKPPRASAVLPGRGEAVAVLALSRDARRLAIARKGSNDASLHDLDAARPTDSAVSLEGHAGPIDQLVFSPDGRWLASQSGKDGLARLWPLAGGPAIPLHRPERSVLRVEISPDGRWLATHEATRSGPVRLPKLGDCQVRLWNLTEANPSTSPLAWSFPGATAQGFRFTPDGRFMLTGRTQAEIAAPASLDEMSLRDVPITKAAVLRDLAGADPKANPPRVLDFAFGGEHVAFSPPDGRWLLSGNQLLELGEGADSSAITLPGLGGLAHPQDLPVGFSPDGRWAIVVATARIELHPLRLDELFGLARRTAGRNLGPSEWKQYLPDRPHRKTFPDLP